MFWPTNAAAHQVCRPHLYTFCKKKLNSSCAAAALPASGRYEGDTKRLLLTRLCSEGRAQVGDGGAGVGGRSAAPRGLAGFGALGTGRVSPVLDAQWKLKGRNQVGDLSW